ncbi:hypothetical protein DFP73DRAFT_551421 [Morchella snyderi]|nr:hypothetical protein DFP73DRAFT_551421 [Morchella snyderi]
MSKQPLVIVVRLLHFCFPRGMEGCRKEGRISAMLDLSEANEVGMSSSPVYCINTELFKTFELNRNSKYYTVAIP